jgi:hypothetical protein
MMNWKDRIAALILVKQELMRQDDVGGIWSHHFPEVRATEESLQDLEEELGYKLDFTYRSYLQHANG